MLIDAGVGLARQKSDVVVTETIRMLGHKKIIFAQVYPCPGILSNYEFQNIRVVERTFSPLFVFGSIVGQFDVQFHCRLAFAVSNRSGNISGIDFNMGGVAHFVCLDGLNTVV